MDESPPATAVQEARVVRQEDETETARVERRRVRVPTSVIVTVVVALMSVWVAPALTRQWDDRQKARDLQVSLVGLVSTATAQIQRDFSALLNSSAPAPPYNVTDPITNREPWDIPRWQQIVDDWGVMKLNVATRLRLYYGDEAERAWDEYAEAAFAVGRLAAIEATTSDGNIWDLHLPGAAEEEDYLGPLMQPIGVPRSDMIAFYLEEHKSERILLIEELFERLSVRVDAMVDMIASRRPTGFSTTRRDLLRDLLP